MVICAVTWHLRYASHLGYRSVEEPLFRDSVGTLDPVAHLEFAAGLGFAGVQYALARGRPQDEQARVGAALARLGLEAGCMIYTTFDRNFVKDAQKSADALMKPYVDQTALKLP